ncbi:dihydropteroate synthase [Helicobacter sp. 11S02629-2]|uniref:dihydropteroate synthase n=1 Tax=Helicobacter sp. 11S02629-2 TaxID=1476195 RepID=UPI000BA536B3|nr:dihydropteroate synthase [Helicobacter sp. 11S02629-2]PAF43497.1 dihydropteroate synthase [Helicobacter sp. 11S02629-2]
MYIKMVENLHRELVELGPDLSGLHIMDDKTEILGFKIEKLKTPAMHIIKQNALSLGAELATPKDAITSAKTHYDCLLLGTPKQLKLLIKALNRQPFGLKRVADTLKEFLKSYKSEGIRLMSIVNITSDSFYVSHCDSKSAIEAIHKDIELGADIIDIGAASSRPNAKIIDAETECARLKDIFKAIKALKNEAVTFSIDTYNAATAKEALKHGFEMVNDVSGLVRDDMLPLVKDCDYILMHTRGTPETMTSLTNYENLFLELDLFFATKLELLERHRCKNIILDVGIGFAKDTEENLELLKNLRHFKHFGKELLIGASFKRFLGEITESKLEDRGLASALTHFYALQNGANILRVHDLKAHIEMLKLYKAFKEL